MAYFGMLSFPQTRASLWQIMTSLKHGPYTVCTSHIGSVGVRAIWYIKHIYPLAVELKEAYMAKFGVPSFPQSRASPWQIMISWQFGPQSVCTSRIRSVGPRVFCSYSSYTRLTVESKSRIWPSLGCCGSHKRGHPCGRFWFHGSLDHVLYLRAIY